MLISAVTTARQLARNSRMTSATNITASRSASIMLLFDISISGPWVSATLKSMLGKRACTSGRTFIAPLMVFCTLPPGAR